MSIKIELPQTDLIGVTDFTVTVIETNTSTDENSTLASDSQVVLTGATAIVSGQTYFRLHLPSSPDAGDYIRIKKLTTGDDADKVQLQSALVHSTTQDIEIDTDLTLVYINSTIGWIIQS